jgi:hypothetical protein
MPLIGRITNLDRRKVKLGLYLILSVFLMGSKTSCAVTPGFSPTIGAIEGLTSQTIRCNPPVHVTVLRGNSAPFQNPCDPLSGWVPGDNFEVYDLFQGFNISTDNRSTFQRTLSVDANAPVVSDQPFAYTFSRAGQWGEGTIYITTGDPLVVAATANPATIFRGSASQLNVTVSGGTRPYTYEWRGQLGTLSATNIPNPIARPATDTTYEVVVTDAQGVYAGATVQVNVSVPNMSLNITATPPTINPGQNSQLIASVTGGVPPYTYSWAPIASIFSNPPGASPIASPKGTTTYTVTVTDSLGSRITGSVTVVVHPVALSLTVTATPPAPGLLGSQLNATVVAGGTPPFAFAWIGPPGTLNSTVIQDPLATPASLGNIYTVTVTDATGATATGSVLVTNVVKMLLTINAIPAAIIPPLTSQLTAVVVGGTAPFSFSWAPIASLSSSSIFDPVAAPTGTTVYTLIVTDSLGVTATGSVTVVVLAPAMTLNVTAIPAALALVGQTSQLNVTVAGGTAPFKFAWTGPPGTLSATDIPDPLATPATRSPTIYTVVVTDATGATATGSVLVTFLQLQ